MTSYKGWDIRKDFLGIYHAHRFGVKVNSTDLACLKQMIDLKIEDDLRWYRTRTV